jgi:hypothetical protein
MNEGNKGNKGKKYIMEKTTFIFIMIQIEAMKKLLIILC